MLIEQDGLMAMPVVQFSYPPQRGYIIENDKLNMKYMENAEKRSQDFEKIYHDAGQFYLVQMKGYWDNNGRIYRGITPIIVDEMEVQDIDNETDWKIAEIKYNFMINGEM